jgi:hypothetical protein
MAEYHNNQKECPKSKMNSKGFCNYGIFEEMRCICTYKKLDLYCPFAWRTLSAWIDNKLRI